MASGVCEMIFAAQPPHVKRRAKLAAARADRRKRDAARESADTVLRHRLGFNSSIDFVVFLKDEEVVHCEVAPRDSHAFDYSPNQPYP